jgi:primosomal protein N'
MPGMRVTIPFGRGNKPTEGVVLSVEAGNEEGLKPITACLDETPWLDGQMLRLAAFLKERYFCTFYDGIRTMLPAGFWLQTKESYCLTDDLTWQESSFRQPDAKKILELLRDLGGEAEAQQLESAVADKVDILMSKIDKAMPESRKQGIFFDGQIYDAYAFVAGLVRRAAARIVLIDNYIDETVLTLLGKRGAGVHATVYTGNISKQLRLDINKHNAQYPPIEILIFNKAHDRFLIIDSEVYLIGASIKDLGKKWFGFTLMENTNADELIGRI